MKYIVFTGPECCGKTTLANFLARHCDFPLVEEHARTYLSKSTGKYDDKDLDNIEIFQNKLEKKFGNSPHIVCDTDLLTLYIWRSEVFKYCDMNWADRLRTSDNTNRFYFLCSPDIPWVYDPQRENPLDRQRLFHVYKNTLEAFKLDFEILEGNLEYRMNKILLCLESRG